MTTYSQAQGDNITLKIQLLNPDAKIPTRANISDAGLDLYCVNTPHIDGNAIFTYHTGVATEIPEGYVGLLFPRSSIHKMNIRQCNAVGVIDAGYRGEIMVKYDLTIGSDCSIIYNHGDKIAQLVIIPIPTVNISVVDSLGDSERGERGFGSSGR